MRLSSAALALTLLAALAPAQADVGKGASAPPATGAIEAVAPHLTGHRAVYDLTLDQTKGGDVIGAHGTMSYEVVDACDAWATRQRLTMTLANRDGQDIEMVSDYATYESKNGLKMDFHMRQTTDGAVTEQVEGTARLRALGGPGEVHYTVPGDKTMPLPPGTLFPMTHTAAIIAAAQAGKKFVAVPLFDGTGPDGAQDSFITVLNWGKVVKTKFQPLADLPSGYVHVAFFNRGKDTNTPEYEAGMRYWANGIADELRMDFGDFVMQGKLSELKVPKPHC